MAMSGGRHPWQAAFVAFCNGAPLEEISQIFSIPEDTLRSRLAEENWRGLRDKLPIGTLAVQNGEAPSQLPAVVNAKLKLIEENRAENLKVFVELRNHLVETVKALAERRLKMEKQWNFKGAVVRAEVDPGPGDWVNIGTYARTIAEGTYRALGDFQAQEKAGQDAPAGAATAPQPAITIILPGAIARPREERPITDAKEGQVIDLTPLVSEFKSQS